MRFLKSLRQTFGFLVLTLGLSGLLGTSAVQAAECKGMTKSKCESADRCSWVNSYTTKKGNTVNGYCRSKPGKGSKKSTSSKDTKEKKATKEKSEKKDKKEEKAAKQQSEKKEKKTKEKKDKKDKTEKKEKKS